MNAGELAKELVSISGRMRDLHQDMRLTEKDIEALEKDMEAVGSLRAESNLRRIYITISNACHHLVKAHLALYLSPSASKTGE